MTVWCIHMYHQDKLKFKTPLKNYHCKLVLKNLFLENVCLTSNLELNHTLIMYTCTPKHTIHNDSELKAQYNNNTQTQLGQGKSQ